jgi:MFS family permease
MIFLATVFYLPTYIQGVLKEQATNSGLLIIPLTFTLIFGSVGAGQLVAQFGRYQWVTILGSSIAVIGLFLLAQTDINTSKGDIIWDMMILGLGLGLVMPILTLVIQNTVKRSQLGSATASVTYLRSLGSTLGIAIIGSIINHSFSASISEKFPAPPSGVPASSLDMLKQTSVIQSALTSTETHDALYQRAISGVTSSIPPGPSHDMIVGKITEQLTTYLNTVLTDARSWFDIAIVSGFRTTLIVCILMLITSCFLRDVPLAQKGEKQSPSESPMA